ncbi:UbiA family prenyltransferase [Mesorhizobium huakuii]|uniref:UbiA family prenyltransferase n=1 Tax=Mesorhizobium huakuii TaxID=28104 RepID=A0ABZ0VUW8_9HYPH|nr:UbiA family prenyltransferase [Mesorhizobium huakuii]WQC00452.1 UbiA family prenyltransferase [Mesorhizobium huakuii]
MHAFITAVRIPLADMVAIARPDHWFKNVFMIPGLVIGVLFVPAVRPDIASAVLIGLISTCLIASANYTINEWLDAESDRHHPLKHMRSAAQGRLVASQIFAQYLTLSVVGLGLASLVSKDFFLISNVLLMMGVLYNVRPFRTKDRSYLDVISESVNNPLRLLLGWFIVVDGSFPPSSVLMAYWMGGAFLMAIKRYAEFRFIGDPQRASLYRRSFAGYDEKTLLLSGFFYAITASFFLAIFLIKHRIEFVLSFPLFAILFVWYLSIGMKNGSAAQRPEKLFRETPFMAYVGFLVAAVAVMQLVDMPFLYPLLDVQQLGQDAGN